VKFGINIINFGPLTSPESLRHDAQWSEQVGFHLAMVSDHVAVTPDVAGLYPAPFYEPFTTLAWLAGITTRIELGATVVILPYRHPLLIARIAPRQSIVRLATGTRGIRSMRRSDRPRVALAIDSTDWPYAVLSIRSTASFRLVGETLLRRGP
jgi:Luciferase-like monooxygenase